jgi:short-subunit dehydrogenase
MYLCIYALCKTAVERICQAIAAEVEEHHRLAVVALYPGMVQTDMLKESLGQQADAYPEPDEWAKVTVPIILGLNPAANGKHLSLPDAWAE